MADDRAHLTRAARAGGLNVVGAVVGALCGFGLTAVITNGLTADQAGTVFATTSLFLIGVSIVGLGTDVGLVRWLPAKIVNHRVSEITAVLRAAMVPVLVASFVLAAVAFGLADLLANLTIADKFAHLRHVGADQIKILALFLPVAAGLELVLAATRGFRTMRPTVFVEGLGRSLVQVGAVLLAVLLHASTPVVVLVWCLPYLPALGLGAVWLKRLLRKETDRAEQSLLELRRPRKRTPARQFWGFTGPRALASISQTLLKRLDIVLVAALRSPAEAALYAAASRFVTVGQVGVQAIQQALGPQLAGQFARGQKREAEEVFQTSTAWSMLMAWPVYIACAVLAGTLLSIFGARYTEVTSTVVVLCSAMLFAIACGPVDVVLLMAGRSWLSLANTFAALVVNLTLNVLLIPKYGALGAGIAWSISIVVRNLLPLIQVRHHLQMSPLGTTSVRVGLQILATVGVVPAGLALIGVSAWLVLAALAVGGIILAILLWRQRELLHLDELLGIVRRRIRRS